MWQHQLGSTKCCHGVVLARTSDQIHNKVLVRTTNAMTTVITETISNQSISQNSTNDTLDTLITKSKSK